MEKTSEIRNLVKDKPEYLNALFRRGYLVTTNKNLNVKEYPFCNMWNQYDIDNYKIYVHKDQYLYKHIDNETKIKGIIIGHAYNPFDMQYEEEKILKNIIDEYKKSKKNFFNKVSELTGIHVIIIFDSDKLVAVQDCAGIESCYFGKIENNTYITSHVQLVADICDLEMDEYVKKLVKTKCYNMGNRYLPGNISSYKELKRLGPNTYLEYKNSKFKITRFYPFEPHHEINSNEDFEKTIDKIVRIMHNNCILVTQKWKRPAISLSGGMDSKTTLSVANGLYDRFLLYSFQSKEAEKIDSEAAHKICKNVGLYHKIYDIKSKENDLQSMQSFEKIINHNVAYMMNLPENEIKKINYFYNLDEFDIEIKSWVSEIARVTYERKYNVEFNKTINERELNIMQTRYFGHPFLLKKGDKIYLEFMKNIGLDKQLYNFESGDICFWEIRCGSWETNAITQLEVGNRITIIYNNRKLMEFFLSFCHESRKKGKVHQEIIKKANEEIENQNIEITNFSHKFLRVFIEKLYFKYRTIFYKTKLNK